MAQTVEKSMIKRLRLKLSQRNQDVEFLYCPIISDQHAEILIISKSGGFNSSSLAYIAGFCINRHLEFSISIRHYGSLNGKVVLTIKTKYK